MQIEALPPFLLTQAETTYSHHVVWCAPMHFQNYTNYIRLAHVSQPRNIGVTRQHLGASFCLAHYQVSEMLLRGLSNHSKL